MSSLPLAARTVPLAGAALILALAGGPARAAGVVEVHFVKPETFADIGRYGADRKQAMEVLERHFKALGQRLPEGRTLKIDVLDVNLAGELKYTRHATEVRVMRGGADWPQMTLRWDLSEGGRSVSSGEERIDDMAYLLHNARLPDIRAYAYDLRLIDEWFGKHFAEKSAP
jgi:hypothetical protein